MYRPKARKNIPTPRDHGLEADRINIKTFDNLNLSSYLIRTDPLNQKGTIILVHGIRAAKEHFLPLSKMLSDSGYNSVILDLRAHGESEGKYCTYGFYEKQDLSLFIDSILRIDNISSNLGIWGQSLGGAISLQTLAIDSRLKFGIVESTFSDFRTIVHDYIKQRIGFEIPFMSNYFIWRAEKIASFKSAEVVPLRSAALVKQPVLVVHGTKDDRIKIEYGLQNFKTLSNGGKEFFECPEANHLNVWTICRDEYFKKVFNFIDKQSLRHGE